MRIVVLGLSLSSSWGNGHATTWRALLRGVAARGHAVLFLERDVPWYRAHRDLPDPGWCRLEFYADPEELGRRWRREIAAADAVVLGSFVPDGVEIARFVQATAGGATAFYDIDTPVTLARLARGEEDYVSAALIPGFDLYLSFTGGPTLQRLERAFGARRARVLHCSADPASYRPQPCTRPRWDLSYLGTYSEDRQPVLERLLIEPARQAPHLRFAVAGAQYPDGLDWPANVERIAHVPPDAHPDFYAASRWTLNVTRADMAAAGHSPSVRLFEAAACGTPVISDSWPGLSDLFEPGREIRIAAGSGEVLAVLEDPDPGRREAVAEAARRRVLAAHTAAHRAAEFQTHLAEAIAAAAGRDGVTSASGRVAAL